MRRPLTEQERRRTALTQDEIAPMFSRLPANRWRVEILREGRYELLHGSVDARSAEEAIAYIRSVLPRRCDGRKLRATVADRRHEHPATDDTGDAA